jgi:integrase/recombinase XerD
MPKVTSAGRTLHLLLDGEIEPFLQQLRAARYARGTLQTKRNIVREFAQWAQENLVDARNLNNDNVSEFLSRLPQPAKYRVTHERATVRAFLEHLYARGLVHRPVPKDDSGTGGYLQRYEDYLRRDRGLAENSVHVYVPFIRDFLSAQIIHAGRLSQNAFDTLRIRSFLVAHAKDRSDEYTRLLATSLRSFFRFLFFTGETTRDLSSSVPMVRKYGCQRRRHFFHPNKPSALWPQQTDR